MEWNIFSQTIAVNKLLDMAFNEYGLHKVYTFVFASNTNEIDLMRKAGFQDEAILKKEVVNSNGQFVDVIRMSIFVNEFERIKHE